MTTPLTIECSIHFRGRERRKELHIGQAPKPSALPTGRVPRVSRLMALAIRFEQLLRAGEIADYAELARLGHVSRARMTQIMNLLMLAPDIQQQILFLPPTERGHDSIHLRQLQPVASTIDWWKQRRMWQGITPLNRLGQGQPNI